MANGRDANGRYIKGHKSTGGRKPRPREEATLARFKACVSDADVKAIVKQFVRQAKGGDIASAKFIMGYLLGLPRQTLDIDADIVTNVAYDEALQRVYDRE